MKLSKKTKKKTVEIFGDASYSKVSFCFAKEKMGKMPEFLRLKINLIMLHM